MYVCMHACMYVCMQEQEVPQSAFCKLEDQESVCVTLLSHTVQRHENGVGEEG